MLFGGLAVRLASGLGRRPALISAVMGLGGNAAVRWKRRVLGAALRFAAAGGAVIVQNPEDRAALIEFGLARARIALIRGSGVDPAHFAAPARFRKIRASPSALVGRMLRSKGVLDAAAAIRSLREEGLPVELILAGTPDPDSSDSLSEAEMLELAREPGIEWLGHVADVREVWARAAIAVLPSSYGEGVPKSLLEAASCARPIIASDMPGCREVVAPGETGSAGCRRVTWPALAAGDRDARRRPRAAAAHGRGRPRARSSPSSPTLPSPTQRSRCCAQRRRKERRR